MNIPINKIRPNPKQPRTIFDEDEMANLAQSIRENGIVQPIVVEQDGEWYTLVAGERRWRAAKLAGLTEMEATVRQRSNHRGTQRLMHALIENVQRAAMGPVDEARAYQELVDELGTADAVSKKVGVSISTVGGRLSLLELCPVVQDLFNHKRLPYDLQVIATFKHLSVEQQERLASMAVTRKWKAGSIQRVGGHMLKGYHPRKREIKQIEVSGHFDALAMVDGKVPADIKESARATCRACSLYKDANLAICKECPLPDFLRRLK